MMRIMVNGEIKDWPEETITYAQLCGLAGQPAHATAVYRGQQHGDMRRSGSLYPGKVLDIEEDMIFSVVVTDNA